MLPPRDESGSYSWLAPGLLQNLIDNAIKFTPDQGTITLSARLDVNPVGPAGLITLQDTGPGIPAAPHHALFQKYRQVETKAARRRGNGLGLDYCRLIVEAHGGKIWVETPPEQGACFHILLPAVYSS